MGKTASMYWAYIFVGLVVCMILTYIYFYRKLVRLMRDYHNYHYEEHKMSIHAFMFHSVVTLVALTISNILEGVFYKFKNSETISDWQKLTSFCNHEKTWVKIVYNTAHCISYYWFPF